MYPIIPVPQIPSPEMAAFTLIKLPATDSPFLIPIRSKNSSLFSHSLRPEALRNQWLRTANLRPILRQRRPVTATVSFSLPTTKPAGDSSTEKVPRWSWRAIKSFAMAELEARKLKYPTTGTEALLMGILIEGTGLASKFLRANGITLMKVREEAVRLVGKGDMYFFSPEHPPLTQDAQNAIDWAVHHNIKSGGGRSAGEITCSLLLLGVWSQLESPGHTILLSLGFTDDKANELESLASDPHFTDD